MVAMQLAVMRPERLTGIAVFDTSCRKEPTLNRLEYKALGVILRTLGPTTLRDSVDQYQRTQGDVREVPEGAAGARLGAVAR